MSMWFAADSMQISDIVTRGQGVVSATLSSNIGRFPISRTPRPHSEIDLLTGANAVEHGNEANGDLMRSFTVEELMISTHKFSNCCLIGAGGFAKVSCCLLV